MEAIPALQARAIPSGAEPADPGEDLGRELFRLVVKAREAGLDPERSCAPLPRSGARLGAFVALRILFRLRSPWCLVGWQPVTGPLC